MNRRKGKSSISNSLINDINECFVFACENGDYVSVSKILDVVKDFNIDVTDYIGRSALRIAIENEHLEVVQILINRADSQKLREALLLSIFLGHTHIAESILRHPKYKVFSEKKILNRDVDSFWQTTSSDAQFSPDVTPLILAAQYKRTEIVQLLLINGDRIEKPHEFECKCNECSNKFKFDSLRHAQSRLNAYRGLSSESYISLASMDPILTAFELGHEIRVLAQKEKYFKNEYLELAENLSLYAVKLLNYVRGRDELDVILNKTGKENEEKYETLARIDLAIKYRETRFVAHSNCQQKLIEIWFSGIRSFSKLNQALFYGLVLIYVLMLPIMCLLHIIAPRTKAGQWINQPFLKFVGHISLYMSFIGMIIVSSLTLARDQQTRDRFSLTYPQFNDTFSHYSQNESLAYRFPTNDFFIRMHKLSNLDYAISIWILGFLAIGLKQMYKESIRVYIQSWSNILNTLMTIFYLFSFGLKYYTIFEVNSRRDQISKSEFWSNVERLSPYDLNAQKLVYETFYWLNDDRFYWISLDPINLAEGFFALANVFSITRLIFYLPAHQELGPLQITLGKMIADIMRFIVIFIIIAAAFLFALNNIFWYYQSNVRSEVEVEHHELNNMNAENNFGTIGKTFGTIFWALFGLGNSEDAFLDPAYKSEIAETVGTIIFGAFHISTIVLLINMLIAMMSKSYEKTRTNADTEWKFSRSILYLTYIKDGGSLPPPFNLLPTTDTIILSGKSLFLLMIRLSNKLIKKQGVDERVEEHKTNQKRQNLNGNSFRADIGDSKFSSGFDSELTYSRVIRRIIKRFLLRNQKEKEEIKGGDLDELKQDLQMFRFEIQNDLKKTKLDTLKTINTLHGTVSLVGEEFLREAKNKQINEKFDNFKSYSNDFNSLISEFDTKNIMLK